MDIEKRVEIAILVKYYGELLTERQKSIIEMYVDNNLSFAEVSEELNITRQAVKDSLDTAFDSLKSFEARLHFIERDKKIKESIEDLKNIDILDKQKIIALLED